MQKIHIGLLGLAVFIAGLFMFFMPEKEVRIEQIGFYRMTITSDPSPLNVGFDARLMVELDHDNGQAASGCDLRFRQYMPGMAMSLDYVTTRLQEIGNKGRYEARTGKFPMGGDWAFEYTLVCDGRIHNVDVPYVISWPE